METDLYVIDGGLFDDDGGRDVCPLDLVEAYLRRFVAYPSEHALARTSYGSPTPI